MPSNNTPAALFLGVTVQEVDRERHVLGAGVHGVFLVLHHLLCAGDHHDPHHDALSTPGPAALHLDGLAQGIHLFSMLLLVVCMSSFALFLFHFEA